MRIFSPVFASVVLVLAAAQSLSANDPHSAAAHKPHVKHTAAYVKPGAAVALSHDYDGTTNLSEFETLTASLSHIYEDGTLSVGLLAPDDIQISAFTPILNRSVFSGSTLDLPIQFSGAKQGHFSLSLETVYKGPDGHESRRVLSIPVTIGGEIFEKSRPPAQAEKNVARKTGLIGLAAIEVIE